ncbi:hypothetical protein H5410_051191 [Solanum commersonii]|uniref:Uncharacterized protein n=1 Tax=Solanum commersonii TaxID=4109 RepID=A0A9J5WZT6_SOLCO|nr:hypothetical protein H5410_051191 [Solanum commersonii]
MEISSLSGNLPVSNAILSNTHLPHEDDPTPYPTHSLKLSVISIVVFVSRPPSRANQKYMSGFRRPTSNLGKMNSFLQVPKNPLKT